MEQTGRMKMKKAGLWKGIAVFLVLVLYSFSNIRAQGASHLGGYGELHYNKPTSGIPLEKSAGILDFHRFVLYFGYRFNDWVSFHSELELEHALMEGSGNTGKVALEQAYIQLRYLPEMALRTGILLIPVGFINPYHEPPTFHGVERPNVEKYLIPSTWREAGIGLAGKFTSGFRYEVYGMAGLDPDGLDGKTSIRGARQNAFKSSTQDFALTARLDYQINLYLSMGISGYFSTLEKAVEYGEALAGANLFLKEFHVQYRRNGWQMRGLVVFNQIAQVRKLNSFYSEKNGTPSQIGNGQLGAYVELAREVIGWFNPEAEQQLFSFLRFEFYDTHYQTTDFERNPDYQRKEWTFGLSYFPAGAVVLKADYQFLLTAGSTKIQQFNLGMGYNF